MSETQIAIRPKASQQLATLTGMEPAMMLDTIKSQCFKCNPANVSDAQLAAFVSIAAEMGVNPLLPGMLYAFPIQGGGIIPMMGPDGVYKKLTEHPEVDSWETTVYPEDVSMAPTHATTRIWRKGRERPLSYTALISEWKVNSNPNWNSRPRHMLAIRSLKQCARQIIHGVPYDEDERVIMGEINVTPGAETTQQQVQRKDPPARAKKGVSAAPEAQTEKAPVIEAEIMPEAQKPAEETKADAMTRQAAEAAQAERDQLAADMAKREAKLKEPAAPPAATEPPKQSVARVFLKDGETLEAECTVVELATLIVNMKGMPHPSVQAKVKGEFNGDVLHVGGAISEGERLSASKPWKVGATVLLTLVGKLNKNSGKVLARVEGIEEAQPANPAMDVE